MSISANDVKKLREETQAGMLDCKKALEASHLTNTPNDAL